MEGRSRALSGVSTDSRWGSERHPTKLLRSSHAQPHEYKCEIPTILDLFNMLLTWTQVGADANLVTADLPVFGTTIIILFYRQTSVLSHVITLSNLHPVYSHNSEQLLIGFWTGKFEGN